MLIPLTIRKAALSTWSWIKARWQWLALGAAALFLLFFRRRVVEVVAPEAVGAENVRRQASDEAERKIEEARAERDEDIVGVREVQAEAIQELNDEQRRRAGELHDDPEALNEYLLDVGKRIRGN